MVLYLQLADYTRNSLSVRNSPGVTKRLTRKDTVVLEEMLYIIDNECLATIVVTGTGTRLRSGWKAIRIPVAARTFSLLKSVQNLGSVSSPFCV